MYLGIDPGAGGGLARVGPWFETGDSYAIPMPATERDIWDYLTAPDAFAADQPPVVAAVIEQVGGYMGGGEGDKGGGAANGSAMFKFGASYGGLRMALTAAGIPFEAVQASTWQKALRIPPRRKGQTVKQVENARRKGQGCCNKFNENMACDCLDRARRGVGSETKGQFKARLKAAAQRLFPRSKVTLATADALLIAHYCRLKTEGRL